MAHRLPARATVASNVLVVAGLLMFLIWVWVPLVPSCIHLRFVDGLGCPSINRKYRDRDHRITTRRVRLATLSRTRPHGLDESLSADRFHRHQLSLDGTDDQTIEVTSASVAKRWPPGRTGSPSRCRLSARQPHASVEAEAIARF